MLEFGLIALATLATGGLLVLMRQRWLARSFRQPSPHTDSQPPEIHGVPAVIAQGGLYAFGIPRRPGQPRSLAELQLEYEDLVLRDAATQQVYYFPLMAIQWVSAIEQSDDGIAGITLHLERGGIWHLLTLRLPQMEMGILANVLRQAVNPARRNLGNPLAPPIGPITAFVAGQTLQGETILGEEVGLYILPSLLIVLHGDRVHAKLDLSSIRRVLAVERTPRGLDAVLRSNAPEGIVRLYSLSETVAFALPQFRELADEIGSLARCPVEHIYREDKVKK